MSLTESKFDISNTDFNTFGRWAQKKVSVLPTSVTDRNQRRTDVNISATLFKADTKQQITTPLTHTGGIFQAFPLSHSHQEESFWCAKGSISVAKENLIYYRTVTV